MNIEKLMILPNGKTLNELTGADDIIDCIAVDPAGTDGNDCPDTLAYRKKYQSAEDAFAYNNRYAEKKSRTTRRETAILQKLLNRHAASSTVLDLPCGGGRLSPAMDQFTRTLIEMDLSPGQLLHGKNRCDPESSRIWIRASGLRIPLKSNSIDGAVCIRLSHHLYQPEEREKLISELLRVAKRFVIFYFVDADSPKYRLRRWRNRIRGASQKVNWMSRRELDTISQKFGGRVTACPAAGPFQPHRYALIEKPAAA